MGQITVYKLPIEDTNNSFNINNSFDILSKDKTKEMQDTFLDCLLERGDITKESQVEKDNSEDLHPCLEKYLNNSNQIIQVSGKPDLGNNFNIENKERIMLLLNGAKIGRGTNSVIPWKPDTGFDLFNSNKILITGGIISRNTTGIYMRDSSKCIIKDNKIVDNGDGLGIFDSIESDTKSVCNLIKSNIIAYSWSTGIRISTGYNGTSNHLQDNTIIGSQYKDFTCNGIGNYGNIYTSLFGKVSIKKGNSIEVKRKLSLTWPLQKRPNTYKSYA